MSRIVDSIMGKDEGYSGGTPTTNLAYGGQNGLMTAIGSVGPDGKKYSEWISSVPYVSKNVIPVIFSYPGFFKYMPNPEFWRRSYKALIELHPESIEGLQSGLTVEFDETKIAGTNNILHTPTDVNRATSDLTLTFKEKANKTIQKFIDVFLRYGVMDPDFKKPLVSELLSESDLANMNHVYSNDMFTASILFIEPDNLHRSVVDAWFLVNVGFKDNGERTGASKRNDAGEGLSLSIAMTSLTLAGDAVMELANNTLKKLTVLRSNPETDMPLPQDEIAPDVQATDTGIK